MTKEDNINIQIALITYNLWHARNQAVFEDYVVPEDVIIRRASSCLASFLQATVNDVDCSFSPKPVTPCPNQTLNIPCNNRDQHWIKPDSNFIKANSDANLQIPGRWGMGCILRDDQGLVKASATWSRNGFEDVCSAEAYVAYAAMVFAAACGVKFLILESDCKLVVDKLKAKRQDDRTYEGSILDEIWKLSDQFEICRFSFTRRTGNQVANSLAKLAHDKPNNVWWEDVPSPAHALYLSDLAH